MGLKFTYLKFIGPNSYLNLNIFYYYKKFVPTKFTMQFNISGLIDRGCLRAYIPKRSWDMVKRR